MACFLAGAAIEVSLIVDTAPHEQQTPASTLAPAPPAPASMPDELVSAPETATPEPIPTETPEPTATATPTAAPVAVRAAAVAPAAPLALSPPGDPRVEAVAELCGADAPLVPYAGRMIAAAQDQGLDWRLLPVIAYAESGCGRQACAGNAFGWGACAGINPETFDESIDIVARGLARGPYAGRSLNEVMCIYVAGDGSCSSEHARGYRDRALERMAGMVR